MQIQEKEKSKLDLSKNLVHPTRDRKKESILVFNELAITNRDMKGFGSELCSKTAN